MPARRRRPGCGIIIVANKWDLMKGRGADFSKTFDEELRRQLKFLDYAPILHISASTGERAREGPRDHRQDRRGATRQDSDGRVEPLRPGRHGRPPAREPGPTARPDPLRRADRHRAADVRVLHERRDGVSLLLRAVSGEPIAGVVRVDGNADQDSRQEELERRLPAPHRPGPDTPGQRPGLVGPLQPLRDNDRIRSVRLQIDHDGAAGLAELAVHHDASEIVERTEQQIIEALRPIGEPQVGEHAALTVKGSTERRFLTIVA